MSNEWHKESPECASTDVTVPRARVAPKAATPASWTKGNAPKGGRPAGTLNKITRTMKEAAVAAAEELGQLPIKQWAKQLNVGDPNGMKGYFKFLAVKHPKSYAIILARIMPLHINTGAKKLPKYLTAEQMRAELREAGLPEDLIKFMHPIDRTHVDPRDLDDDPYDDPEADEEDMVDVTPEKPEQ